MFGCFFYFQKSMWRKIHELGLVDMYLTEEKIRRMLKLHQVLAFVPEKNVTKRFMEVKTNYNLEESQLLNCFNYFEDNYIRKNVESKTSNRRNARTKIEFKETLFPIKILNVFESVLEDLARPTNFVEAWHKAFSSN